MDDLKASLTEYNEQLTMVDEALKTSDDDSQRESLQTLRSELLQLIHLTQESLDAVSAKQAQPETHKNSTDAPKDKLDEEYALFMQEMASTDAGEKHNDEGETSETSKNIDAGEDSDIEEELSSLLGMKCAVHHTHRWGGQPSLHNAMVCAVVPRQDDDQFTDLQVQVLFTHPTHPEMLPCPFFLDGECKFDDEKCRYSHGTIVPLSNLKEAIVPDFDSVKCGSRVLLKIKPPSDEDISLAKKSTEKYHLWHRAIVKSVDSEKRCCVVKLEHGVKTGEKRKSGYDELDVNFEDIFPLNNEESDSSDSDDSLSDTEYPDSKAPRPTDQQPSQPLVTDSPLQHGAELGAWERHTRGIGSKLMLAMGYVPGAGLGSQGAGRVQPVEARGVPKGRSLDHCLATSDKEQDPLKVAQRLQRLQKKEEERNKRAYEREVEREKRNVFNFLNKTLGDKSEESHQNQSTLDIKQTTSKQLNVEHFRISEDAKKIEREISKLNSSLSRHSSSSVLHKNISLQISGKTKELETLKRKESQISKEQSHRKDKKKMTIF